MPSRAKKKGSFLGIRFLSFESVSQILETRRIIRKLKKTIEERKPLNEEHYRLFDESLALQGQPPTVASQKRIAQNCKRMGELNALLSGKYRL